jgi:hypothetical protein
MPRLRGWPGVRDKFENEYVDILLNNPNSHVVLLIDFDQDPDRLNAMKKIIPDELRNRVFVIGAWSEPEDLRKAGLGTFEEIGLKLAEDCRSDSKSTWGHELLKHNADEVDRMKSVLRPILFRP